MTYPFRRVNVQPSIKSRRLWCTVLTNAFCSSPAFDKYSMQPRQKCRWAYQLRGYVIPSAKGGKGGTAAAAPPPFSPGNPALCGSRPLVPPYYCRLGDLLCLFVYPLFVYYFVCVCICVFCCFLGFFFVAFSFSTLILLVGSLDL